MAPLAGVTDAPTRSLYKRMGAALVYSEMVSAKGMYYGDRKSEQLLTVFPEEKPIAFQIFGREPEILAFAAEKLNDKENVILDINMGCPVPKVFKNGEGSALLGEPDQVYKILKAVSSASKKPVTVKMRTGISDKTINCVEIAKACQEGGAAALAVHGRTREQYYSGNADWSKIADVKSSVSIPVIGNGDVDSWKAAKKMFLETGCDFIMIGRAALGNPWIFKELVDGFNGNLADDDLGISVDEKKSIMIEHLESLCDYKGENVAVKEMRKHMAWYTKGMNGSAAFRGKINSINNKDAMIEAILSLQ